METEKKYPKERDVDWNDFASRAKTVLLLHGTKHHYYDWFYEDDLITISFVKHRPNSAGYRSFFEVTRLEMPGHPAGEHLHRGGNPVYMESGGECICVHGEGRYIYDHILFLSLGGKT